MDLSALKRDRDMLLALTGQKSIGKHLHCPFHEDRNGSFSIWQGTDGVWLWKCFAGCGTGTVIDAAMRKYGCGTAAEAFRAIERELGVKIGRDEDYQEPRIDRIRAERLIVDAHNFLMGNQDIQERLLLGKRGIADLDLVARYRLGFLIDVQFRGWRSKVTGWVLPITDAGEQLVGVKFHTEMKRDQRTRNLPKCFWAPFGKYPPEKPRNGTYTLWPPPEDWPGTDRLYLCPGELKALAMIGMGYAATSVTSGESSKLPPRLVDRIVRAAPRRVLIGFDNDDAGRKWRDCMADSLRRAGLAVATFNFTLPQEPPEPPRGEPAPNSPADLGFAPDKYQAAGAMAPVEDGRALLVTVPAENGAPIRLTHRFFIEHHPRPEGPCPACGGTEFWEAWGEPGCPMCIKCTPPPPARNTS